MINCIIIDDEPYAINTLSDYIKQTPDLHLVAAFTSPTDAIATIEKEVRPDLVFLDINMPGMSGLEVATVLPANTPVIYVTAHADNALKAFETNAYDYLLKPVSITKFLKSVQKVKSMIQPATKEAAKGDYFFINPGVKGKMVKLEFKDIIYIQGLKNYVVINFAGGKQITYLTMTEIEQALPADLFLRIHKSFIINLNRIQTIDGNTVILSEHFSLPLGGTYKDQLMSFISKRSITSKR